MLINAVKNYRAEVGEKSLPKAHMKFLVRLQKGEEAIVKRPVTPIPDASGAETPIAQQQHAQNGIAEPGISSTPNKDPTPESCRLFKCTYRPSSFKSARLGARSWWDPSWNEQEFPHTRSVPYAALQPTDQYRHAHQLRRGYRWIEQREGEKIHPDGTSRDCGEAAGWETGGDCCCGQEVRKGRQYKYYSWGLEVVTPVRGNGQLVSFQLKSISRWLLCSISMSIATTHSKALLHRRFDHYLFPDGNSLTPAYLACFYRSSFIPAAALVSCISGPCR